MVRCRGRVDDSSTSFYAYPHGGQSNPPWGGLRNRYRWVAGAVGSGVPLCPVAVAIRLWFVALAEDAGSGLLLVVLCGRCRKSGSRLCHERVGNREDQW